MSKTRRRDYTGTEIRERQAKESVPPLLNEKGELATTDTDKAEVPS